ncbi:MAG: serine hydrolase domain-containing protein [Roseiflexaceae bacterium]|nr:serine hydrolase domain-containing protein [Roseiflexaceae bacterium]
MARPIKPIYLIIGTALLMLFTCSAPLAPITIQSANIGTGSSDTLPPTRATKPDNKPTASARPPTIVPTRKPTQSTQIPLASPANDELSRTIDRYIADLTTNGAFSGAILVARNGQIILANGYGPADGDRNIVNTAKTRFRLASDTKQFTAMATLMLANQGRLKLSDPICNYIDQCPDAWKPILIRHLLNHTSGLYDYTDSLDYDATESQPATPQQLVARFRDQPLGFTPGDLYDYCNSGYVLLGLIVERASGMSYPEFIQQNIFQPLGMSESGYDSGATFDPTQAFPHSSAGQKATYLNTTTLFSAGGLYSTVEDLYRWDQALYTEQLIPQALLDEMFTPGNGSYGYGWKIERPYGRLRISHAGNMTGVSNFIARYPEQHATIIVLSNIEITNAVGISDYIASIMLGS